MNRNELAERIAVRTDLSRKQAEEALNAFTQIVTETLKSGEKVQLIGFGTFEVKDRPARVGHSPLTGEPMDIPASRVPSFKAGKYLKDEL